MKSIHTQLTNFNYLDEKEKNMLGPTSFYPTFGIQRISLVNRTLNIARI